MTVYKDITIDNRHKGTVIKERPMKIHRKDDGNSLQGVRKGSVILKSKDIRRVIR